MEGEWNCFLSPILADSLSVEADRPLVARSSNWKRIPPYITRDMEEEEGFRANRPR